MHANNDGVAARFGANLRSARLGAGLTQEKLAGLALLHRTAIGLLERGERLPRIDTLLRLARPLAASPSELLRGIEWEAADARFRVIERSEELRDQWLLDFGFGMAIEAGLLGGVIDLHPKHLPASRWVPEVMAKKPHPGEGRAIEAAMSRLIDCDLLRDDGRVILPTKAALRFAELPF